MSNRSLLKNIRYGDELDDLEALLLWPRNALPELNESQTQRVGDHVIKFFSNVQAGIFGGPITAGDASMIAAMMEWLRPAAMVEFGVASGWSSAFILDYAREAGLLPQNQPFLTSFDLCSEHQPQQKVGSYLHDHHPDLARQWTLSTEVTSATLLADGQTQPIPHSDGPVLALVDAGHEHPWPFLDILYLWKVLPIGSWVILQDFQMMERWIADCIIFDVPSPSPIRGVNFAVSHWPGSKILGYGMAYNCAAIRFDVPEWQMRGFIAEARRYPYERPFAYEHLLTLD